MASANPRNETEQELDNYTELREISHNDHHIVNNIPGLEERVPQTSYKKYLLPIFVIIFIFGPGIVFLVSPGLRHKVIEFGKSLSEMRPNSKTMFLFWTIGLFLSLLAQHTGSFEMVIAYVFKKFLMTFFFILSFKLVGVICVFFIVTKLLHHKLESLLSEYDLFYLLKYLAIRRPRKSLILMRFSIIPKFIKNYGIPLLGYELWYYVTITILSDGYFTLLPVLIGITARSFVDIEHGNNPKNSFIQFLSVAIIGVGIGFFVYFIIYTKNILSKILESMPMSAIKRKLRERSRSYGSIRPFLGDP